MERLHVVFLEYAQTLKVFFSTERSGFEGTQPPASTESSTKRIGKNVAGCLMALLGSPCESGKLLVEQIYLGSWHLALSWHWFFVEIIFW